MPAIQVRNLGKRYRAYSGPMDRLREIVTGTPPPHVREFVALEGLNLDVPRGCALGVIGPNGAGKSTLLKILAGIVDPSEGDVRLTGKVASIIELGAGFHPDFTGRENVFLNAAILGYSDKHARSIYDEIASFCELGRYMDMPVKTYSSGMFVRLAFALAISVKPDILLVDEALAVGDAVFAHRCLARIREMRERGVTIVLVTHDTNTVAQLCDRAIFLDRGRLAGDGPPKDVIHLYLLNVAERLTTLGENGPQASKFHEIGALETTSGTGEKRFGSFEARITRVSIEDASGTPAIKLVSGRPAIFRMVVHFDRQVDNPVFGVMFKNRYGMEIFGTNTLLRSMNTGAFKHGDTIQVSFMLPLQLGGGVYSASFAVHTADGHFFDYRVDTKLFEVLGSPETIGIVNLPAQIKVSTASTDLVSEDDLFDKIFSDAPQRLDMGDNAEPFLTGEWYAAQRSDAVWCRWLGRQGRAFISTPDGCLAIRIRACTYEPLAVTEPLEIEIHIGEEKMGARGITAGGWQDIELELPQGHHPRIVPVSLRARRTWAPRDADPLNSDTRQLSILVSTIEAIT
ncbi:MAG: ABC transporter ATP-binding protein [bacterium]|nr:ABC transporter ATP-binding protein [Candidatus Sumerlaeota bacterium]